MKELGSGRINIADISLADRVGHHRVQVTEADGVSVIDSQYLKRLQWNIEREEREANVFCLMEVN